MSEWLDPWRGGAETSAIQFVHHLLAEGIEVDVVTRSRLSPAPGLRVHVVRGAGLTRAQRSASFSRGADALVERLDVDLVHAITPCENADLYQPRGGTVAESIERNLALVRSPSARTMKRWANALNFKQRFMLDLERRILGRDNGPVIVAISGYVVDQMRRHYRVPDHRLRVVFNAVDPDTTPPQQRQIDRAQVRRDYHISDEDLLVILVAHNFRLKGVARWMEAYSRLLKEGRTGIRSLVIGKAHSPRWEKDAARLGLKEHLRFTGPTGRVPAFMHAADILVHPTYYDPCSRVVLEGMAAGLPCVTTRFDGASEVIDDGVNGRVIDAPDEPDQLVEAIHEWQEASVRQRIGAAASAIRDRISMVRHAADMINVYRSLASRTATVR